MFIADYVAGSKATPTWKARRLGRDCNCTTTETALPPAARGS